MDFSLFTCFMPKFSQSLFICHNITCMTNAPRNPLIFISQVHSCDEMKSYIFSDIFDPAVIKRPRYALYILRGAVIQNDDPDIPVSLVQHALQGFAKQVCPVIRANNDRNPAQNRTTLTDSSPFKIIIFYLVCPSFVLLFETLQRNHKMTLNMSSQKISRDTRYGHNH